MENNSGLEVIFFSGQPEKFWAPGHPVFLRQSKLIWWYILPPLFYFKEGTFEPWHDKTNKMSMRPAKTQISLGIRPVWSESSLCAQ